MIASILMPPVYTVPPAALVFVWIIWYWRRLGAQDVPESRRRIRRASLVVMLVGLPPLIAGLSYLDNKVHQDRFVGAWILVMALVVILLVLAMVDIINNLRVHVHESQEDLGEARTKLRQAIRDFEREREQGGDSPTEGEGR